MRVLLVSGLGPGIKNQDFLSGTLFDPDQGALAALSLNAYGGFDLTQLGFDFRGRSYPLMRPRRDAVPHLTTFTLKEILHRSGVDFEHLDTLCIWENTARFPLGVFDAILLSTSYIWEMRTLRQVVNWLCSRSDAPIILGGQFSNLKYKTILDNFPELHFILRGDGEIGIPGFIRAMRGDLRWEQVPGLVMRQGAELLLTKIINADLDRDCSASLHGQHDVVPYESMRGCPFSCKFCSFPMASPIWRYKSAEKIAEDWRRYKEINGAKFIKAMDSTFTVPHVRMRRLFELLPDVAIDWEAYTRANVITSARYLDELARSQCRFLSIGFESMNPTTLRAMNKLVTTAQNRHAFELLKDGDVGYRCSFMTGYPGETPEQFADTQEFLMTDYKGHFMLSVFSLSDEQMPVWQDADRFQIKILDPENPDYSWSHSGMDYETAKSLNHRTLDLVRVQNPHAVLLLWQARYQHWLMPHLGAAKNLGLEKLVERIGFLVRDFPDAASRQKQLQSLLNSLETFGVYRDPNRRFASETLMEA
jgi:hypothetical protein